ncbi:hypothetical protein ASPZODRAFT_28333 [Penicilliopsis zonata CBS 506.65]|uniref:Uncharacterized protein n=1 Tax=Penicilliopsis zonata CBS 506.65 TaxID=1073090 RepID=A0A1L9S965_9EURO|nr:hypothetical protein ASPZODRAFT_28333 [Penicilliopsis zonata CBS 506.65]OJJ43695.1 hypothetical protein ASPZODRAFT_28333 [Penicilliopsis zonata CBS 506.65]
MHQTTSSSSRGFLPTRPDSKIKDHDEYNALLRPGTRDTIRSRFGSVSTSRTGSRHRKNSVWNDIELSENSSPARRSEPLSKSDLKQVKKSRIQGEEYLRDALVSIGTLATDITRRLDYTYYTLLERVAALNSTIESLHELSHSISALCRDFEREITSLDSEIHRQVKKLEGFEAQTQKIEALEERMKAGRRRVKDLGNRLDAVRNEITNWENREIEWQARVGRRLRFFWGIVTSAALIVVVAVLIQNWSVTDPGLRINLKRLARPIYHESSNVQNAKSLSPSGSHPTDDTLYLSDGQPSVLSAGMATDWPTSTSHANRDPLKILEELSQVRRGPPAD